ncbi:hypothetical protein A2U01_0110859 [Trifolium medium]|uniref:Uncharacterized protein n=1 Tax=Trifolium medium TaxID=97028 RepID=A0A392VT19_9FABA|nr:hypothetical protein [Trifolium medium]
MWRDGESTTSGKHSDRAMEMRQEEIERWLVSTEKSKIDRQKLKEVIVRRRRRR